VEISGVQAGRLNQICVGTLAPAGGVYGFAVKFAVTREAKHCVGFGIDLHAWCLIFMKRTA
jgi:hypothetical protein